MWRMQEADRALTEAEWRLFMAGLSVLLDFIQEDICYGSDDAETGIHVFDNLTPEQKLALLADITQALRDPATPMPNHTAANEGAIAAVFATIQVLLETELDSDSTNGEGPQSIRRLLRAVGEESEQEEPPPDEIDDADYWESLLEEFQARIFWDTDFAMADQFLDLPPDEARAKMQCFGIDPDYYLAVPDEPTKAGLIAARQTLAGLGLQLFDPEGEL